MSPGYTQELSAEDDWGSDDDCSSDGEGEHTMYRETEQVPPYPQPVPSPAPLHHHSQHSPSQPPDPRLSCPTSPVSSASQSPPPPHQSPPQLQDHVSIPMQFHHNLPEQITYQRHPFPHSLSSPHILSPVSPSSSSTLAPSPSAQLRLSDSTRPTRHTRRTSHHRHHGRRASAAAASGVSGQALSDETRVATMNFGLGITAAAGGLGFDDRGQGGQLHDHQLANLERGSPPPTLHPYVGFLLSFTLSLLIKSWVGYDIHVANRCAYYLLYFFQY